jgi:hypothetical protein
MGLTFAPATDSIMGSVPREQAGVGSAVNDTTRQLGGVLGVAVIGSLLATRYSSRIDALAVPAGTRSAARSSLGAALQEAGALGGSAGQHLVEAARSGFVNGFQFATLVVAGVIAGSVVVVALFLPNRPTELAAVGAVDADAVRHKRESPTLREIELKPPRRPTLAGGCWRHLAHDAGVTTSE